MTKVRMTKAGIGDAYYAEDSTVDYWVARGWVVDPVSTPPIPGWTPVTRDELVEAVGDTVAPPTGNVAADTAAVQAALDAAAAAGGGRVVLASGGQYTVTGVTIDTNVILDLNGGGLTLADGANASVVATRDYATLFGGNTTGGPYDFGIVNGFLDGNKANQTDATKPVLAIYGRRYILDNLLIRNGKGAGLASQWSTISPFQAPNGFESFVTRLYVHHCDGDGINFQGPHDAYFSSFFIVACAITGSKVPLTVPDNDGRANGSNFQQFHIYGGGGYNYGLVANNSGVRYSNFVVEGAQLGQALIQAAQVMLDGFHLYTGSIATATAKGVVIGDATHANVNGCTIRGRVENCGGGALDVTFCGWNNDIDLHHFYYSGTVPTKTDLGVVGTLPSRNKLLLRTTDSTTTFAPTAANQSLGIGPVATDRATSADTRDLISLRNELGQQMYRIDWRGRRRVVTGTGAPVPSIAVGANAGSGATVAVTGDDTAGRITVTTGTSPAAGTLATLTFSGVWGNLPFAVITPKEAAGAALDLYNGTSTAALSVKCGNAPAPSTAYTFDYVVVGV